MKQFLQETVRGTLQLVESTSSQKNPNCLGTLSGPCADYAEATRNENFYSRKLWVNVFNDDLVKEALEDRVLIGELDHPGDRLETKATNACIVMTGYEFDDNNQVVNGTFDILNTPNGKILRSLLDYGCRIGVSSRGEGDVTDDEQGRHVVDEDGYYFVAFDAVVLPAVKKAKPSLKESVKRTSLKDSILRQIAESTTKPELELIKKVVEAAKLPDIDSIVESINNKSKELEGANGSSNLMEDLERSTEQIRLLTEENRRYKVEVADCKSKVKRFIESRTKMVESEEAMSKDLEKLTEQYSDLVFKSSVFTKKVESLEPQVSEMRETIRELRGELKESKSLNSGYELRVRSLEESLGKSQQSSREKSKVIDRLNSELSSVRADIASMADSKEMTEVKVKKLINQYKESLERSKTENYRLLVSYAQSRSNDLGVNSKRVTESLKSGMTSEDVDRILKEEVSRSDRYRKFPTVNDDVINVLSESTSLRFSGVKSESSEEDAQTAAFMEQFYSKRN